MRKEDGEVATRFRIPRLLVEHVPGDGHEVGPVRIRLVIHRGNPISQHRATEVDLSSLAFSDAYACPYIEQE